MMHKSKVFIIALATTLFSFAINSAPISQKQIDQFTSLPPAQQAALAKTMGVDLNDIKGQISQRSANTEIENTPVMPRDVDYETQGADEFNFEVGEGLELDKQQAQETKLKPFGYDVLANEPQTYAPTMDIAIPQEYIVGPGDVISIQVFGKENMEHELPITREGEVILPHLGPFSVGGLSFVEMKQLLKSKIKEKIIGVNVVVGMASLRSMRVFVLGDAYKPGPYHLSSLSSISHALFAAGGIRTIGSLRNIQLKRSGKLIKKLDLYELLINGDSSNDVLLQSGDVIFIAPVGKRVSVDGEVRRPGIYELAKGDNFSTVLAMAGGLLPSAYAQAITVERYQQQSLRQLINIDVTDEKQSMAAVAAGDVIKVAKSSNMFTKSVSISGAVVRQGKFQWQAGQRITDLLPQVNSHLLENADLSYGLVVREINLARHIEVLQFSIAQALTDQSSADNLLLQANDQVLIFANNEASRTALLEPIVEKLKRQGGSGQPVQLVEIVGEVKYGGSYPLAKNTRVDDLVVAAGGLKESAYLARADITRDQVNSRIASKEWLTIDLGLALTSEIEASADNPLLQSKDRLNIYKIPEWSENHVVELRGEFVFPGKYTIRRGESLSELIKRAGGFTEFAHLKGSIFTREKLQQLEKQNLVKLSEDLRLEIASKSLSDEGSSQSYNDMQSMLAEITKLEPVGRLVIDLPKALEENNYNIALEGGDILYVPTLNNSVNVIGQVQVASSHMYDEGLSADDYLLQSGGSKKRADEERIYIISANGTIKMLSNNWFSSSSDSSMKPGDTVVVPLDAEYMNDLTLWTSATTILYNTAVAVAAISGI